MCILTCYDIKGKEKHMKNLKNKNTCENCKHFVRHYIYENTFGLSALIYGHCKKTLKHIETHKTCDLFEKSDHIFFRKKNIDAFSELTKMKCNLTKLSERLPMWLKRH